MGFNETETNHINLALEATLVNVITSGYEGRSSEQFDLVFECCDFQLVILHGSHGLVIVFLVICRYASIFRSP